MRFVSLLLTLSALSALDTVTKPMNRGSLNGEVRHSSEGASAEHYSEMRRHGDDWTDSITANVFGYTPYGEPLANTHPGHLGIERSVDEAYLEKNDENYPEWSQGVGDYFFQTDQHGRPSPHLEQSEHFLYNTDTPLLYQAADETPISDKKLKKNLKKKGIKLLSLEDFLSKSHKDFKTRMEKMSERSERLKMTMQAHSGDGYYIEEDFAPVAVNFE